MAVINGNQNLNHSHMHIHIHAGSSIYRTDSFSRWCMEMEHNTMMIEKRQLFLRSYQFCRKKSLAEKIRTSLVKVKRGLWFKLRSDRKISRFVLGRFRFAFHRRRRFVRLVNKHNRHTHSACGFL